MQTPSDGASLEANDNANKFIREALKILQKYMEAYLKAANERAKFAGSIELARWLKSGGEVQVYRMRGNCQYEFGSLLDREGIPYIKDVNGNFIVKTPDYEKMADFNHMANIERGNYYKECDKKDLIASVAFSDSKDKSIYEFKNLDFYDKTVLRNKCNGIMKGFMVGTERNKDGTYNVAVKSRYLYNARSGNDLCHALLKSALSLHTENERVKKTQIKHDLMISKEVSALKGCREPHYIVSRKDPSQFITIDSNGFSYTEVNVIHGERHDHPVRQVDFDSPDYEPELEKYLSTIFDKAIITDLVQLNDHIVKKFPVNDNKRPTKELSECERSRAYHEIGSALDGMIKRKLGEQNPEKGLERYYAELRKICAAVKEDRYPAGYTKDSFDRLVESMKEHHIDPDVIKEASAATFEFEAESYIPKRGRDMERTIEKQSEKISTKPEPERTEMLM